MKKNGTSKTKLRVILGYLLVVTVMTIGLIALYRNLVDFSNKRITNEDLSELMMVGNILSSLYEVENEQDLLTAESARDYYIRYDSLIPEVKDKLEKLKEFTDDNSRKLELDSIGQLMEIKCSNLLSISSLLDSLSNSPKIISESESSFVPKELNREITDYLGKKNFNSSNTAQSDTSVIAGERKRFFDRVRDVFVANPDSTIVIENKSLVSDNEFRLIVDTIVNKVRYSERLDLSKQREIQSAIIRRQEIMNHNNRTLTARIDGLLKNIEQQEVTKSLLLISERERALSQSQNTMLFVSLLSTIIAILFAVLFLIDINRSQRYRMQLELSNKRIMDLLDYREKLMLTISHYIKAPTVSILGFIDLMAVEEDNKKKESYLQNMKMSADHVLQLVSKLLDFHRLDKGSWQLHESQFDLRILIEESTSSFRPLAEKKGLAYVVENQLSEKMFCYGDSYVLKQIFNNLISNAIKYTSKGEIKIIADTASSGDLDVLTFTVKDTGEGIDIEDQKVIFDEFRQVNNNQNVGEFVYGSGLGLAITKGFVNELNGEIHLTSIKGEGSEFVVEIPLKLILEDDLIESAGILNGPDLEGVSLLYIDDDPVQLKMMSEIAQKKKMKCITESNSDNVAVLLQDNKFDIVFVDIQLGQKSGFDLAESINKKFSQLNIEVPIVALSARSDISKDKLYSSGFTDFLNKPISIDQLYDVIFRYVKRLDNVSHISDNGNIIIKKSDQIDTISTKSHDNNIQIPVAEVNIKSKGVRALYDFVKEDTTASLEILKSFISETRESQMGFKEAFENGDVATASKISHKMLPLYRMIGNEKVVGIMEQLENNNQINEEDKRYLLDAIQNSIDEGTELERAFNKE